MQGCEVQHGQPSVQLLTAPHRSCAAPLDPPTSAPSRLRYSMQSRMASSPRCCFKSWGWIRNVSSSLPQTRDGAGRGRVDRCRARESLDRRRCSPPPCPLWGRGWAGWMTSEGRAESQASTRRSRYHRLGKCSAAAGQPQKERAPAAPRSPLHAAGMRVLHHRLEQGLRLGGLQAAHLMQHFLQPGGSRCEERVGRTV